VAEVYRICGATASGLHRAVEDMAARAAGITNEVTAADLAALLSAIVTGAEHGHPVASRESCAAMLDTLCAQELREDLAAGLPPGTRIAHKNGWVSGVRHGAGVVFPADAPPYALVVCATTPLAHAPAAAVPDAACRLLAVVAAASWSDRHAL
jgi:beta-lactamase class A